MWTIRYEIFRWKPGLFYSFTAKFKSDMKYSDTKSILFYSHGTKFKVFSDLTHERRILTESNPQISFSLKTKDKNKKLNKDF